MVHIYLILGRNTVTADFSSSCLLAHYGVISLQFSVSSLCSSHDGHLLASPLSDPSEWGFIFEMFEIVSKHSRTLSFSSSIYVNLKEKGPSGKFSLCFGFLRIKASGCQS